MRLTRHSINENEINLIILNQNSINLNENNIRIIEINII